MDNGLPFASEELTQFLQCHCIDHVTSFPHFPRSNGFVERQEWTIKRVLSTAQDTNKPLEDVLLNLWLTPIGPNMLSPWEILHNRTFQHPGRPSQPVDMESVRNYLLSHKQSQKAQFDKAHGAHDLPELGTGQEVLFWSPVKDEYIPWTMVNRATAPYSYVIEAQGKRYHGTREHLWPIHLNLPKPATQQPLPPKPKVSITHIPKPNPKSKYVSHPVLFPGPSLKPPCHICHPPQPYWFSHSTNAAQSIKNLLQHLSTLIPYPQC